MESNQRVRDEEVTVVSNVERILCDQRWPAAESSTTTPNQNSAVVA